VKEPKREVPLLFLSERRGPFERGGERERERERE